jgi:hypothetical protein
MQRWSDVWAFSAAFSEASFAIVSSARLRQSDCLVLFVAMPGEYVIFSGWQLQFTFFRFLLQKAEIALFCQHDY